MSMRTYTCIYMQMHILHSLHIYIHASDMLIHMDMDICACVCMHVHVDTYTYTVSVSVYVHVNMSRMRMQSRQRIYGNQDSAAQVGCTVASCPLAQSFYPDWICEWSCQFIYSCK